MLNLFRFQSRLNDGAVHNYYTSSGTFGFEVDTRLKPNKAYYLYLIYRIGSNIDIVKSDPFYLYTRSESNSDFSFFSYNYSNDI